MNSVGLATRDADVLPESIAIFGRQMLARCILKGRKISWHESGHGSASSEGLEMEVKSSISREETEG